MNKIIFLKFNFKQVELNLKNRMNPPGIPPWSDGDLYSQTENFTRQRYC